MKLWPLAALAALAFACGKKDDAKGPGAGLPLVTPPVKAASPAAFQTGAGLALTDGKLSVTDFKTRFFTSGPTNVYNILAAIDERLSGINSQTANISPSPACLTQAPIPYTITPWGQSVAMYAQCYEKFEGNAAGDPSFVQWGVQGGVTYLYVAVGGSRVAAIATPATGAGNYDIHAWIGLGYTQGAGWDSGSYGVMELDGNSSAKTLEMTVAGMGFGYCGAQLRSDGTNIFATGSADMGSTCVATDSLCVGAADATTPATCAETATKFALPAIGRAAAAASSGNTVSTSFAASPYGTPVTLNGTATDALYFGPLTPTDGAGSIGAAKK